jgi:hypothetical protein
MELLDDGIFQVLAGASIPISAATCGAKRPVRADELPTHQQALFRLKSRSMLLAECGYLAD